MKINKIETSLKHKVNGALNEKVIESNKNNLHNYTVNITNTKKQELDGYGFALTQGAAHSMSLLPEKELDKLLEDLFTEKGINMSAIRICIGASDLSTGSAEERYSYAMTPDDKKLEYFSLNGLDSKYLFPILKKVVKLKPSIKIMASPWTAPTWMKTNHSYRGGRLRKDMYDVYADYFVKYIKEMRDLGFKIWTLTVQNEPLNENNNPSMLMSKEEQFKFIDKYLGPKFVENKIDTKIVAYDHNTDVIDYAIDVAKSNYVDGSAFHLYEHKKQFKNMTVVHDATKKNIYFSEQWWGSEKKVSEENQIAKASWDGLRWHAKYIFLGSTNNWSKCVIEWNVATMQYSSVYPIDAARDSVGAISIHKDKAGNYKTVHEPGYYLLAHFAKYFRDGARVYEHNSDYDDDKISVYMDKNGTKTLIILNEKDEAFTLKVISKNEEMYLDVKPNTLNTFNWK